MDLERITRTAKLRRLGDRAACLILQRLFPTLGIGTLRVHAQLIPANGTAADFSSVPPSQRSEDAFFLRRADGRCWFPSHRERSQSLLKISQRLTQDLEISSFPFHQVLYTCNPSDLAVHNAQDLDWHPNFDPYLRSAHAALTEAFGLERPPTHWFHPAPGPVSDEGLNAQQLAALLEGQAPVDSAWLNALEILPPAPRLAQHLESPLRIRVASRAEEATWRWWQPHPKDRPRLLALLRSHQIDRATQDLKLAIQPPSRPRL